MVGVATGACPTLRKSVGLFSMVVPKDDTLRRRFTSVAAGGAG
jgi:hypothetical protein